MRGGSSKQKICHIRSALLRAEGSTSEYLSNQFFIHLGNLVCVELTDYISMQTAEPVWTYLRFYGSQESIWKVEVGLHNRCEDSTNLGAEDGYQAVWVPRKRLTMSPGYNKETKEADYAILELVPEIRLNPAFAMPACFPKHPPVPNMMATVTGWGKTSGKCMHSAHCIPRWHSKFLSDKCHILNSSPSTWSVNEVLISEEAHGHICTLRFTEVPILPYEICNASRLGNTYREHNMNFPKEMICAGSVNGTGHPDGSKDACSVRTKNTGGFGTTLYRDF